MLTSGRLVFVSSGIFFREGQNAPNPSHLCATCLPYGLCLSVFFRRNVPVWFNMYLPLSTDQISLPPEAHMILDPLSISTGGRGRRDDSPWS